MSVQVKSTKHWEAYFWCNKKEKQKQNHGNEYEMCQIPPFHFQSGFYGKFSNPKMDPRIIEQ